LMTLYDESDPEDLPFMIFTDTTQTT